MSDPNAGRVQVLVITTHEGAPKEWYGAKVVPSYRYQIGPRFFSLFVLSTCIQASSATPCDVAFNYCPCRPLTPNPTQDFPELQSRECFGEWLGMMPAVRLGLPHHTSSLFKDVSKEVITQTSLVVGGGRPTARCSLLFCLFPFYCAIFFL